MMGRGIELATDAQIVDYIGMKHPPVGHPSERGECHIQFPPTSRRVVEDWGVLLICSI